MRALTRFLIESRLISKDWAVRLSSVRVISASPISAVCVVTTVVLSSICRMGRVLRSLLLCRPPSQPLRHLRLAWHPSLPLVHLLGPVLVQLLSVLLSQLVILGPDVRHDLAEVLRFGGIQLHGQPRVGNLVL